MKFLVILLGLTLQAQAGPCVLSSASRAKFDIVKTIISDHQEKVFARHGQKVELVLKDTSDCRYIQATAGHTKLGTLEVTVYPGLIDHFSPEDLIYVACHELGHVLGEVTPVEAGTKSTYDSRDSLEGEADYFAGGCTRDQLKKINPANVPERLRAAVVSALQFFHGKDVPLDPESERTKKYRKKKGIDPEYPNPSCRLLTVLEGAQGSPRPTCWYNP